VYHLNRENFVTIAADIRGGRRLWGKEMEDCVLKIIDDVRRRGDEALVEYTKVFDKVELSKDMIKVGREEVSEAYSRVSERQVDALKTLKENIERVERETLNRIRFKIGGNGVQIIQMVKPIDSVGCYIPGGEASYPTSLLMATVPAKVAGVDRVAVTSPPRKLSPALLVAADLAGASEIYRVGGVQAIAALAYGTETVKPVDKIVGPGGAYVTLAKAIVAKDVPIDMLAGPSELLVYADEGGDVEQIVLDLIAQAEHSPDTLCGLVTVSRELAERTLKYLEEHVTSCYRSEVVRSSIEDNGFILLAEDEKAAVDFINEFSPEHLEIFSENFEHILESIKSVGAVTVNGSSVLTDYYSGINHILPTYGQAKRRGGLSCLDFLKIIRVAVAPKEYSEKIVSVVRELGECEGLPNHANSIKAGK